MIPEDELRVWVAIASGGLIVLLAVMWMVWRIGRRKASMVLLQQQIESMRAQLNQSLEGNIRRVQEQVGAAIGQVSERLRENAEVLQSSQRTIGERLDNANRVVGDVHHRLGGLGEATQRVLEVGKDIASLQQILRSPKLRGGIGELLLAELLAQLLPAAHYELQYAFRSGERVDAMIRIGDGIVPVDAKFPLEDFRRMIETEDETARERARRALFTQVKKHVDSIASKYILPDEGTYDFALMYVPAESVFYEIVVRGEPGDGSALNAYALERRVIPVSPSSFFAYLQSILVGLKGMRIEEDAREILGQLGHLQGDLDRFREDFRLVGRHLGNATAAWSTADKRMEKLAERFVTIEGLPGESARRVAGS